VRRGPYLTFLLLLLCWAASLTFWAGVPLVTSAAHEWQTVPRAGLLGRQFWFYVGWSVLLHSSWTHLLLNSLALLVCGVGLERIWGSLAFGGLVLLSGGLGSMAQAAWWGYGDTGVSGVAYACVGALLAIRTRGIVALPKQVRIATIILLVWLALGIARGALGVSGIGNISHLVGFGIGVAYSLIKERYRLPRGRVER
jgi:membrane associated rhomboid family serine protease